MANDRGASWVHIVVAVITVAGGIAVALISKDAYTEKEAATPAVAAVPQAVARSPLAIAGVLIGKAGDQPFVSEVSTQFAPKDEVAITVRYTAAQEVSNFPVRLSARIASGLSNGVAEQVADVSRPGNSFWTFRFKPKDGWIGSQQFVWIEVDGQKEYSQTLNINSQ